MNATNKIELPACELRIDGNTYQYREVLRSGGWKYDGRGSGWTKTWNGGKVIVRQGCRLVRMAPMAVIYDTTSGSYSAPGSSRHDHDEYDMV